MKRVGYKLSAQFEDTGYEGFSIGFEILFPRVYDSAEEAEQNSEAICAWLEREQDNTVVIRLYQFGEPIETIRWDEWWKYKCYRVKEAKKNSPCLVEPIDYEPYSEKFEVIFMGYAGQRAEITRFEMQYLSYGIEPTFKKADDETIS